MRVSYEIFDVEIVFYWRCFGEYFKFMGIDGEVFLDEFFFDVLGFCKYI